MTEKAWQARAWGEWLKSHESEQCIRDDILVSRRSQTYLINRLCLAFNAGLLAAEKHYRETEHE